MNLIGHNKNKIVINTAITSAKKSNKSIPHMLFAGSAGCGKTTLARELAYMTDVPFFTISPDEVSTVAGVFDKLKVLPRTNYDNKGNRIGVIQPPIIFIDEIHRQSLDGQEVLGIAMEEYQLEYENSTKRMWLPYFTVIGATTDDGKLSKPYRDRFKLRFLFEPYSLEESLEIIKMHSKKLGILLTPKAIREVAVRGRGIPRIMVGYIERIRDKCYIESKLCATSDIVTTVFEELEIDSNGFTAVEIKILNALYNSKSALGQENLAIIVNESVKTLTNSIEPYLIQQQLIIRSGKGRQITERGREYLEKNGHVQLTEKEVYSIEQGYVRK